jgi:RNA polymerase primary sigma factor
MVKKVNRSNDEMLGIYFKQIKAFPLLSFEEELELSREAQQGNVQAKHKLVNSNLRLVVKIAGAFKAFKIPIMDLIQEGSIGLMRAAEKYDYRKNVRFCTYASWWIKQFISRFISNKRRTVRLPFRKEEELRKIQRTYSILCQTLMHQPQNSDIAKELGVSVKDIDSIINMTSGPIPLELGSYDDVCGTMDIYEDYTYCPERNLMKEFSREGTAAVLKKLKDRERRIINYRYQLNDSERYTLREIGDEFEISPETVRQIEIRALKKIRYHANELRECAYVEAI